MRSPEPEAESESQPRSSGGLVAELHVLPRIELVRAPRAVRKHFLQLGFALARSALLQACVIAHTVSESVERKLMGDAFKPAASPAPSGTSGG